MQKQLGCKVLQSCHELAISLVFRSVVLQDVVNVVLIRGFETMIRCCVGNAVPDGVCMG